MKLSSWFTCELHFGYQVIVLLFLNVLGLMSRSFIFTLQEFAQELVSLVDAMSRIYGIEQAKANRDRWGRRVLTEGYNSVGASLRRSWIATKSSKLQRPNIQRRICMCELSSI
jgi:hypothetical protein